MEGTLEGGKRLAAMLSELLKVSVSSLVPSPPTFELLDETIDTLDLKINQLAVQRRELRELRNTLVPAPQLLPKILTEIVQLSMQADERPPGPPVQVVLSHICRRWRSVLLNNACLWTTPDFTKPDLAVMMLERTRDAPLSVVFDRDKYDRQALHAATKAIKACARFKDLCVASYQDSVTILLQDLGPMPILESLTIKNTDWRIAFNIISQTLLETAGFPSLKRVTLLGCSLLEMARVPWRLGMLKRNETLVYLKLDTVFPEYDSVAFGDLEPVMLTNLKHLVLENDILHFHYLLSSISAPRLSQLELVVWDHGVGHDPTARDTPDFGVFSAHLGASLTRMGLSARVIHASGSLKYKWPPSHYDETFVGIGCQCDHSLGDDTGESLELQVSFTRGRWDAMPVTLIEEILVSFLQNIPSGDIHTIAFAVNSDSQSGPPAITSQSILEAMSTLPLLKAATLLGNDSLGIPADILHYLVTSPADDGTNGSSRFPALEFFAYGASSALSAADLQMSVVVPIVSSIASRVETGAFHVPAVELWQEMPEKRC